jgi:hypothetical protein
MKIAVSSFALALLVSCAAPPELSWRAQVAMTAPAKLGGCCVGDLDPLRPGEEIAAVGIQGEVYLVRRHPDGWDHETIARLPGEMIQCVAGDAQDDTPGDELLVFGIKEGTEDDGGPGAAYLLSRGEGGWETTFLLEDRALIHAGCIADFDPEVPGNEILLAGFGLQIHVLRRGEGGWSASVAAPLAAPAKNMVPFKEGVAISCANGLLMDIRIGERGYRSSIIDEAPAGQSRLGEEDDLLIVARDDGVLALLDEGQRSEIYREGDKLRGAVLADLDPRVEGLEAATAGYERRITVLTRVGEEWTPVLVHEDSDRFHHLASGELLAESPGEELVACGYSGHLIVAGLQ